ncbi:hypothetical protein, partial [Enterobacter hormaechei]|uniref:hypothetical protein n=1 Tax=Enterobacter hormaechei TaxID=158836 RepID=UPI003CC74862
KNLQISSYMMCNAVMYMNSRFDKYLKALRHGEELSVEDALNELHKSFAMLSSEEQKICKYLLT